MILRLYLALCFAWLLFGASAGVFTHRLPNNALGHRVRLVALCCPAYWIAAIFEQRGAL